MRKRKRWIIGLLVVFLALCVGMWSVDLPHAFLAGRPRIFAEINSYGLCTEYYAFSEPALEVNELISKDVYKLTEEWLFGFGRQFGAVSTSSRPFEIRYVPTMSTRIPTVPTGTRAIVTVSRSASPLDRLTAWLYSLRFDGPPY